MMGKYRDKKERNPIKELQEWYFSMCNGDWEHTYGIKIDNIDNPGWALKVDLVDSYLYKIPFDTVNIQRKDENDWIQCEVKKGIFEGYGGPFNLDELLIVFLDWANAHNMA